MSRAWNDHSGEREDWDANYKPEWESVWLDAREALLRLADTASADACAEAIRACADVVGDYLAQGSAEGLFKKMESAVSKTYKLQQHWSSMDKYRLEGAQAVCAAMCPQVRATEREKCWRAFLDAQRHYIRMALNI